MLTRTVRRWYGSVHVGLSSMPPTPNARAARAIAPTFSSSFSASSTINRRAVDASCSSVTSGWRTADTSTARGRSNPTRSCITSRSAT